MRAFYKLPLAALSKDGQAPDAVECGRTAATLYLLSAIEPNPALLALGGTRLGARLHEVPALLRKHFTQSDNPDRLRVLFAGDNPADLL
jgi:hypothetical protein